MFFYNALAGGSRDDIFFEVSLDYFPKLFFLPKV